MLRENTMITNAAAALQAAFNSEGSTPETIQAAFDQFGQAIAATIQAEYESANGDRAILAQRGFRVLTSEETRYYEQIIKAGKSSNPVQTYAGLLDDKVMPNTVIEDVYRDLTQEHPLLGAINFQSVEYLTRWILNDHSVQTAVWGAVNSQITQQITSAFRTVEITQCLRDHREGHAGPRPGLPRQLHPYLPQGSARDRAGERHRLRHRPQPADRP